MAVSDEVRDKSESFFGDRDRAEERGVDPAEAAAVAAGVDEAATARRGFDVGETAAAATGHGVDV